MLPELSNLLSWWQWTILAAVPPALVLLYFLKLKRRPVEVPSTYLWHKSIEDVHVNSIWQRLRRNLLLLLQLLLVLLAILAILRPRWQATKLEGSRFVFLVDNSASMQAADVEPTRLDEAKRLAGDLIDQMRSGDAAMVISFSDTARVEQPFSNDRQRLRAALEAIQPTARSTSLVEALRLASGLANAGRTAEDDSDQQVAEVMPARLYIFSDGKFPAVTDFDLGQLDPVFVPVTSRQPANVGIVAFSVSRQEDNPDQLQAFARLANFGPKDVTVSVNLYLEDRAEAINADRLEIPAGRDRGLAFDLRGFESGAVRLEAVTEDQLAVDDVAWAVLAPPRRASVLLVTPGNERLEQALTTKACKELADLRVEMPSFLKSKPYQDLADGGALDLIVYDRCQPRHMPRANTFFIGRTPPEGGWSAKPMVVAPHIIDAQVSHRLMAWVDLDEVRLLAEGTPLVYPPGGSVLIDSEAGPLMALGAREGFEDLVLGFTLVEEKEGDGGKPQPYLNSDWPIRVSFASFALNLLSYMGHSANALNLGNVHPGVAITLDAPNSAGTLDIRKPSGIVMPLALNASGKAVFSSSDEQGVYQVRLAGKRFHQFAVNLSDGEESDIRATENPTIKIGYVDVVGEESWRAGHREIWKELVLIGLAVSLLEWYIYMRRVYF